MMGNRLLFLILLGIASGLILGGMLPETGRAVQFLGDLFLGALLVLVVPLVMASMIVGVSSLGDVRKLGPLGGRTILYFFSTTAIAVVIGLILVTSVQPGTVTTEEPQPPPKQLVAKPPTIGELARGLLVSLIPTHLFAAMANAEMLPLIVFSLAFGAVLTTLGKGGRVVIRFFEGVNQGMMGIVRLLMWAAPLGIGALIAGRLGEAGGFSGFWPELARLGSYAVVVVLGLLIHGALVLPTILRFLGRQPIAVYARNMNTALITAFSTSSSSATLPMTMEGVIERNGRSPRVASFVLPLGATINMNGTALYEAVAAVFIAQAYGVNLDAGQILVVFLTATVAAVGAAGIPEAGLVTMVIVLQAVNLPLEGISLILVIDWFLDRCRTTVNVWGDAVGVAVMDRLENREPASIAQSTKGSGE